VSFIDENKNRAEGGRRWGVESICQVLTQQGLAIAPATYYAAKSRPPSPRATRDAELKTIITEVHADNYGVYGARKMQAALRREKSIDIGRDQTARLMRELGLKGVRRGKSKRTTTPDESAPRPADLVERDFHATRPDQLWVVDLTYIRTWVGFAYLALVIDVFARRILGWALATHLRTALPLEALEMAIWTRHRAGVQDLSGLIHHGDRGSQYLSIKYTQRLADAGAIGSVGSKGDSYDNAPAESTIGQLKTELIYRRGPWRTVEQLEYALFEYLDWWNRRRLHGEIGLIPPAEKEATYYAQPPVLAEAGSQINPASTEPRTVQVEHYARR
jgi:putative transposase